MTDILAPYGALSAKTFAKVGVPTSPPTSPGKGGSFVERLSADPRTMAKAGISKGGDGIKTAIIAKAGDSKGNTGAVRPVVRKSALLAPTSVTTMAKAGLGKGGFPDPQIKVALLAKAGSSKGGDSPDLRPVIRKSASAQR